MFQGKLSTTFSVVKTLYFPPKYQNVVPAVRGIKTKKGL
jgi:hypothetical protein